MPIHNKDVMNEKSLKLYVLFNMDTLRNILKQMF